MTDLRLLGYIRVSSVGDRNAESERFQTVEQQRAAIQRAVDGAGGVLINDPVADADLNVSGGTMRRTRVEELVRMVDDGEADGIVVAWLDRWARTVEALELFKRWAEEGKGKTFISAAEQFDASTAVGRFTLGMMLMVAQFYREQTQERFEMAKKSAVSRGVHVGPTPTGYMRVDENGKLEPDPDVAPHVTEAFRLAAEVGHHDASAYAREHLGGINSAMLRRLLARRVFRGEIVHETAGKHEAAHEPLVDERTWQLAQSRPRFRSTPGDYPLSGLGRCRCGQPMSGQTLRRKGVETRRYNCHNHDRLPGPHVSIGADALEDAVRETIKAAIGNASFRIGAADDVGPLETALRDAEAELDAFAVDLNARRDFGEQAWRAGVRARRDAVNAATDAYRETLQTQQTIKVIPAVDELDDDGQLRRVCEVMIETIDVKPAPGSLAERVRIRWAFESNDALPMSGADTAA
jgi:DNA invertase Pin-like site-specific DNA recombinase